LSSFAAGSSPNTSRPRTLDTFARNQETGEAPEIDFARAYVYTTSSAVNSFPAQLLTP
jgi:hypothetical protein